MLQKPNMFKSCGEVYFVKTYIGLYWLPGTYLWVFESYMKLYVKLKSGDRESINNLFFKTYSDFVQTHHLVFWVKKIKYANYI